MRQQLVSLLGLNTEQRLPQTLLFLHILAKNNGGYLVLPCLLRWSTWQARTATHLAESASFAEHFANVGGQFFGTLLLTEKFEQLGVVIRQNTFERIIVNLHNHLSSC